MKHLRDWEKTEEKINEDQSLLPNIKKYIIRNLDTLNYEECIQVVDTIKKIQVSKEISGKK